MRSKQGEVTKAETETREEWTVDLCNIKEGQQNIIQIVEFEDYEYLEVHIETTRLAPCRKQIKQKEDYKIPLQQIAANTHKYKVLHLPT